MKKTRAKRPLRSSDEVFEYPGSKIRVFSLVSTKSSSNLATTIAISIPATKCCPSIRAWVLALAASKIEVTNKKADTRKDGRIELRCSQ